MKNKIFKNTDENKFAREVLPKQSGLFLVKGSIKLDDTHLSLPTETFLVIPTADMNGPLHSLVICSQGVFFDDVKVQSVEDGEITEGKLDTALNRKVNNNVKTVEQTLSNNEIAQASKNLKFKDNYQNFFANRYSYESVAKLSVKPNYHMFGNSCIDNTFGTNCYYTTLGNNCRLNTFGNDCVHNILGDGCSYNIFGKSLECSKIDSGVTYIELRSNASTGRSLKNIHILSGVRGAEDARLVINIPDEYLNSSRELIITTKRTDRGPSTPEDIVMYYADEVVDKQNKQDNTLATTSKEVVGAINELFNGGVKDTSIVGAKLADATVTSTKIAPRTIIGDNIQNKTIKTEQIADNAITTENIKENAVTSDKIKNESITGYKIPNETILERHLGYWAVTKNKIASGQVTLDKLASSVQNTLGKVGTNIKVLPAGTDLLSDNIEEGVYILLPTGSGTYPNFPYNMNLHPGATAILVKAGDSSIILGIDMSSSDELPLLLKRRNGGNWYGTSIYNKINSKLDASTGAVKTANLANGAVSSDKIADGAVISTKLSDFLQDKVKMVGTNVKEISYKSMGKIPNIDDITETGIYILPDGEKYNGSTYSKLPSDLRYSNIKLLIVGPTSQSGDYTRQTIIAINYSSLVGICTREAYTPTKFVNLPFSYTSIQSAIEGKIDNTSTLTDTEINNIWDNN